MNILFNLKQKFEKFDENWRSDLEKTFSSSNKKSAEKHAFWIDHEFLRIFYHNNFQIAPGVFRSNQPSEKRILEWQREKGIQSIINFRGESNQGAFFIEKNICKEIGIKLINIKLYSSKLPEKEKIYELSNQWQLPSADVVCGGEECDNTYSTKIDLDYSSFFGLQFLRSRNLI